MKYLMLLSLLLLTGCTGAIYPSDFTIASKQCENNEGVFDIRMQSTASVKYYMEIRCNNKAVFSYVERIRNDKKGLEE